MCVLSLNVYFTFFSMASSLNIGHRACASLTLVGIERDTDVCVRVCLCVLVCVCACVRVCTYVLTFCVSLSGCFVCGIYLFLRGTKYISVLVLLYF